MSLDHIVTDTFTHNDHEYDLAKVRRLLHGHKAFLLPIDQLLWVLRHDTPDPKRVQMAKHRYPLIVAKYRGRWTVVDGLHRLEKYRQKGINIVPVVEATPDILTKALIK